LYCTTASRSITRELLHYLLNIVDIKVNAENASRKTALQLAEEIALKDYYP